MKALLDVSILNNILLLGVFLSAQFVVFNKNLPKIKAALGAILAILFFFYIALFLALSFVEIFNKNFLLALLFVVFAASPFIVGKYVKFKTLKLFSMLQLFGFLISLFVLFLIK